MALSKREKTWARQGVLLAITGVSLYVLIPSLVAMFSSWRSLGRLDAPYAILVLICEAASIVCLWELDRIALHTRAWFPVATAQLTGNLAGRVLPGGGATATSVTVTMLRRAGVDTGEATAALATSSLLQLATALALPILALPAMLGGSPIDHSLMTAGYLGIGVFLLLVLAGAAAFRYDRPVEDAGRLAQWVMNHTWRRHDPVDGLPQAFVADRNFVRTTLGEHWREAILAAAANTGFDYLALLCALRAVGASPQPSLVILAYVAAELLALVPLTPGGLGFVEAGLVGTLTLAGVTGHDAVTATLLYRLASYWLPLAAGAVAYVLFRRRYGDVRQSRTESSTSPIETSPGAATMTLSNTRTGGTGNAVQHPYKR